MKTRPTMRLADMRGALVGPFVAQILLLLFTSMILDGGVLASYCMAGAAAHWVMVAYLAVRRRNALTEMDQILVKIGFVLLTLVGIVVVGLVGLVAGR